MPDYASILKRSLASLPDQSPDTRQSVYERARTALGRQLTSVEPPLAADEIEAQQIRLEEAIAEVEAEFAGSEEIQAAGSAPPPAASGQDELPPPVAPSEGAAVEADRHDLRSDDPDASVPGEHGVAAPEADGEAEPRPSQAPVMIMLLLVTLVLVGAGVLAYTQRGMLATMFGYGEAPTETVVADAPSEPAPDAAVEEPTELVEAPPVTPEGEGEGGTAGVPEKNGDRLGGTVTVQQVPIQRAEPETQDTVEQPPEAAPPEPAPAEPAPVEPAPPEAATIAPPAAQTPPEGGAPSAPEQTEAVGPGAAPETGPAEAGATPGGESLVAQRAILYEQGADGSAGQATEGAVRWQTVQREDGLPAIQASVQLPQQDATVTVTIAKNTDPDLPASHMVEIAFAGADLASQPLERVPALVLKPNEQAPGSPLAGAAVPVTGDLFWIALSDEGEQVSRNLDLLREGSWFDLPLLFQGGQRALLTFEKGITGDRIFETVMQTWQQS